MTVAGAPRPGFSSVSPLRIAFSGSSEQGRQHGSPALSAQRAPTDDPCGLRVVVPCLAGACTEELFPSVAARASEGPLQLVESGSLLLGFGALQASGGEIEERTLALYRAFLKAAEGRPLYRVWNYVPRINEETAGMEHYRLFCRGRSIAFEERFGASYKRMLPSASAVGCDDDHVSTLFVAGRGEPCHVENPEQVPAYEYPTEHGPKAPSFSRATAATADGRSYLFISGTAAIKGHATVAPGAFDEQVACTLHNLRLISRVSGAGDDLGRSEGWQRHFKVYLRHASDLEHAQALLNGPLLAAEDRVTWLRADICRAALNIEIEATLQRVGSGTPA